MVSVTQAYKVALYASNLSLSLSLIVHLPYKLTYKFSSEYVIPDVIIALS